MMALQLRQVRMDESWVLDKVALESGKTLENVDSISLQGTYSEKIASFGNAFKNFKNLRSLDLSRNLIFSLEGIEYLKSLQQLNLYYNNIPTTIEVARLQYLPVLKDLDLRLNPVTRNEPDYRLAVVHMLEKLNTLDDREVREGERRAAKMLFTGDETSSGSRKQEGSRERDTTSFLFDEKLSTKVHSNAADDSSKKWASFAKTHNVSTENLLMRAPASNSTSQYRTDQRRQNELEDEYRPLPSPPRSSMRSPVKCSSSKLKGGCRVTFADSKLSDNEFLVRPIMSAGRENMFLAKGPSIGDTDSSSPSHPPDPTDSQYSYLTSTPLKKDLFRMPEAEPRSSAFGEWNKNQKRPEEPKSVSSENSKLKEDHGEEPRNQRLLELSSDLYVTTHLENDRLLTTDDLSTDGKGFGSPSKIRSSSVEDLIRKPLPAYLTQARPFSPIRNKDPSPRGSLSPEKRPTLTYGSPDSSSPVTGLKRAASLNTLLSSKSPSARHKDTEAGAGESTPQRSQSELETPSPVAIILRQLLDLVDRYWNGSGSLLVNQKFLSPARDLLSILMTSPAESSFTRTAVNPFSDEDQKLVYSRNSLGGTQEKSELLKEKLEKVMDENRTLQNQLRHFEAAASLNNSATSNVSFHHDELQRKNELLTRQLELQNEQLKQFRKLQETVNLLQDSHRSLVASNEYLLRQLNKDGSQHYLKTYQLTSGKTYSSSDLSGSTPITSLYDVGQYHKLDRLSTCPL